MTSAFGTTSNWIALVGSGWGRAAMGMQQYGRAGSKTVCVSVVMQIQSMMLST